MRVHRATRELRDSPTAFCNYVHSSPYNLSQFRLGTYRVATDSELMLDDYLKALEVEEQGPHGKMSSHQFLQIMGMLRRSENNRMEAVRRNVPETTRSALMTPGLTMSATSSTVTAVEAWGGKDNAAVGVRGTDSPRYPETCATWGQIRPQVSTSTTLGKLGGRSVPGREADQIGSGVLGSPSQDGGGGRSRRGNPGLVESLGIYYCGSVEGDSDRLGRQPWSAPCNAGCGAAALDDRGNVQNRENRDRGGGVRLESTREPADVEAPVAGIRALEPLYEYKQKV